MTKREKKQVMGLNELSDQLRETVRQIQDVGEFMTANKLACGVGGRLSEEDKRLLRLVANLDPEEAEILDAHGEFVERMAREEAGQALAMDQAADEEGV